MAEPASTLRQRPGKGKADDGSVFKGSLIRHEATAAPKPQESKLPLGLHELKTPVVWRAALLEYVGTTLFTVMSISIPLASGASAAHGSNPVLFNAVGQGLCLILFIFALAAPSGGHINWLITLGTFFTGLTSATRTVLYMIAQLAGSVTGSAIMMAILGDDATEATKLARCEIGDMTGSRLLMSEFAFSFVLLLVAWGVAFDDRQRAVFGPVLAPVLIGIVLALLLWGTSGISPGYTGPGMNPTRCLGPDIVRDDLQDEAWTTVVGPFLAAMVHGVLYWAAPPHHEKDFRLSSGDIEMRVKPPSSTQTLMDMQPFGPEGQYKNPVAGQHRHL